MSFDIIRTDQAPAASGPCSQAVRRGDLIATSLQTARDPQSGTLVGQDPAAQIHRCLCNLQAILEAAGSSLAGALRVTVYLTDLAALPAVDLVYADFFPVDAPAREVIGVSGLPDGALAGVAALAVRH
jgi:2-iminobutanoate/2-iminopropanoate deaminase